MAIATQEPPRGALDPGALTRTLHVVSPPMAGADVLAVQKALRALGYTPGPRDGIYGTATAGAVREFQGDHELEVDGVVGPRTRAGLERAKAGRKPPARRGSAVGRKALTEALEHLGVRETPAGSNRTPFGRWFGVDGVPWCNIFVSYCFRVGADYTICNGHRGAGVYPKGCAYVPTTEAWLRSAGLWVGRTTPRPGDIAIFNWDSAGVPEHIGIVEKSLGGGKFRCVEGNTAVGNDSNGGVVMRRERYVSQVNGFGRVR
jgi:putative peptidoglycan binding protein/CHAP domain-containing protein